MRLRTCEPLRSLQVDAWLLLLLVVFLIFKPPFAKLIEQLMDPLVNEEWSAVHFLQLSDSGEKILNF